MDQDRTSLEQGHSQDLGAPGQARVQGGGPRGLGPPLKIEMQKKKKVIGANLKLFHLYYATFLVQNIIFSAISELGPPLKN